MRRCRPSREPSLRSPCLFEWWHRLKRSPEWQAKEPWVNPYLPQNCCADASDARQASTAAPVANAHALDVAEPLIRTPRLLAVNSRCSDDKASQLPGASGMNKDSVTCAQVFFAWLGQALGVQNVCELCLCVRCRQCVAG